MREKNRILIILIAILILVVAVVYVVVGRKNDSEQVMEQPVTEDEGALVEPTLLATDVEQMADPTQTEVIEDQIPPTPRAGLESTDPATVNLASGDIQLIEVFAFW